MLHPAFVKKFQIFDGIAVLIFIVRFMPLPLGSTQFVQALALGMLAFPGSFHAALLPFSAAAHRHAKPGCSAG